ncbi:hypothetical protein [Caldalkalibacillus mannanilyticus]|uniref:hypothetical protein n=1 Tax=Caldalkalibacillus mannanilyticus TaxID=1418 RepID=UPI000B2DE35E|nr:hypothetical protein [Caldalkalibacillus mannanilyticus]
MLDKNRMNVRAKSEKAHEEEKAPFIGTWFSLGVVGGVIFLTYILLFGFYFARV